MFDEKTNKKNSNRSNEDEQKILYGIDKKVCFACGEKIDKDTKICPYCNTAIE